MTVMWFYVAALSLEHSDAVQAMEGHGFDKAGRFKEHAAARASFRADMLLVRSTEGCAICLGQAYIHLAAEKWFHGMRL